MLVFIFCKYEKVFSGSYPFAEGRISHVKVKRHWKDYMLWLLGLDTASREVLRTEGRRCQHSGKGNVVSLCVSEFQKSGIFCISSLFSAVSNKQDRKCHKTVWKWICDGSVSSSWLFMASANLQTHPEAGWEMGNDTCCIQYLRLQLMLASAQLLHWQLADIWAQRLVIQLIIITSSL